MCQTRQFGDLEACFTKHAAQRAVELKVKPEQLTALLTEPKRVWHSMRHRALNLTRGRWTLGLRECDHGAHWCVTTVLPATEDEWRRADKEGRLGPGRVFDPALLPVRMRSAG